MATFKDFQQKINRSDDQQVLDEASYITLSFFFNEPKVLEKFYAFFNKTVDQGGTFLRRRGSTTAVATFHKRFLKDVLKKAEEMKAEKVIREETDMQMLSEKTVKDKDVIEKYRNIIVNARDDIKDAKDRIREIKGATGKKGKEDKEQESLTRQRIKDATAEIGAFKKKIAEIKKAKAEGWQDAVQNVLDNIEAKKENIQTQKDNLKKKSDRNLSKEAREKINDEIEKIEAAGEKIDKAKEGIKKKGLAGKFMRALKTGAGAAAAGAAIATAAALPDKNASALGATAVKVGAAGAAAKRAGKYISRGEATMMDQEGDLLNEAQVKVPRKLKNALGYLGKYAIDYNFTPKDDMITFDSEVGRQHLARQLKVPANHVDGPYEDAPNTYRYNILNPNYMPESNDLGEDMSELNEAALSPYQKKLIASMPKGKGFRLGHKGAFWSKKGGHAGTDIIRDFHQKVQKMGFKDARTKMHATPDGSNIGDGTTYSDKDGNTFNVSVNYGNTQYDNWYSIDLKFSGKASLTVDALPKTTKAEKKVKVILKDPDWKSFKMPDGEWDEDEYERQDDFEEVLYNAEKKYLKQIKFKGVKTGYTSGGMPKAIKEKDVLIYYSNAANKKYSETGVVMIKVAGSHLDAFMTILDQEFRKKQMKYIREAVDTGTKSFKSFMAEADDLHEAKFKKSKRFKPGQKVFVVPSGSHDPARGKPKWKDAYTGTLEAQQKGGIAGKVVWNVINPNSKELGFSNPSMPFAQHDHEVFHNQKEAEKYWNDPSSYPLSEGFEKIIALLPGGSEKPEGGAYWSPKKNQLNSPATEKIYGKVMDYLETDKSFRRVPTRSHGGASSMVFKNSEGEVAVTSQDDGARRFMTIVVTPNEMLGEQRGTTRSSDLTVGMAVDWARQTETPQRATVVNIDSDGWQARIKLKNGQVKYVPVETLDPIYEEMATNAVANNAVDGLEHDDPPGPKYNIVPMYKREQFAGNPVFDVDGDLYDKCRNCKAPHERYSKFFNPEEEPGKSIYQYAKSSKASGNSIVLRDSKTGAMTYLKLGQKRKK